MSTSSAHSSARISCDVCACVGGRSFLWPLAAPGSADTDLQLETPVVPALSVRPQQKTPSFAWSCPLGLSYPEMRPSSSFSPPVSAAFVFFRPSVHHCGSLKIKCPTSNRSSVQVDRLQWHAPFFRVANAYKQRQGAWMVQLPTRLRHVSIMKETGRDHQRVWR